MPARLLIFSSEDSNMRYASQMAVPDPFIHVKLGKNEYILVSTLEYSRVKREAKRGVKVILWDELKLDNIKKPHRRAKNLGDIAASFILSFGETNVIIPRNAWALHVETLREHGLRVKIEEPFFSERRIKTKDEIKKIKAVGKVTRLGYERALELIGQATIEWDDNLVIDGKKLTSEWLRKEIELVFMENGCSGDGTIVACGEQTAEPHNRGSGPLFAGKPIILDLFPRDEKTGYFFDMTRTVVKGTPTKELKKRYDTVKQAQEESLDVLAPGKVKHIHETVQDVFKHAGYITTDEEGFLHSTGHGLGMEIHEYPRISDKSDDILEQGMVVTVEPGLYSKEHGGVRIEDTVLVTKDGHENLTDIPKTLVVK